MAKYYQKINFERLIVEIINQNIQDSELIGLSENSINIWWDKVTLKEKNIILFDKLIAISKKYGFIIEESNLLKEIPIENIEISKIEDDLIKTINNLNG